MAHSNQIREMVISGSGITLRDVYIGPEGVLTGTARYLQEAKDKANVEQVEDNVARRQQQIESRRRMMEAKIQQLQAEFETSKAALEKEIDEEREAAGAKTANLTMVAELRKADTNTPKDQEKP
jgi:circadian clock protein KaiC